MQTKGWARGLLFLALVWRNLLRHRLRASLTLLGVALGVAVAVAVQLANHSAMAAFERSVRVVAGEARLQIVSPAGDIDENVVARLRPLTDSARLEPVIEGVVVLAGHTETAFRLLGVDLLSSAAFRDFAPPPAAQASREPEGLFLTSAAAARLKLKAGDALPLWIGDRQVETHVAGILPFRSSTQALDEMVAFTDVSLAQELLDRVGRLDHVDLVPLPGQNLPQLRKLVKPLLAPGEQVLEPEESNRQADRMLVAFRTNMLALSYVALIVGAYLIYNAVAVSVVQRRREIATLRAIGTTRAQIFALFALEAGLMGFLGALVGLGLGALLAGAAVKAVGKTVNALYLDAPVNGVTWTWTAFATGIGVGVGLALVAALVPAADAARTPPALAMRPGSWEARQGSRIGGFAVSGVVLLLAAFAAARGPVVAGLPVWGYVAATCVILGCSLLAPVAVALVAAGLQPFATEIIAGLAVRNFRRAVGRNAVAVAALMVGMAMTIGVATMVGSFRTTVAEWVGQTLPADFYLKALGAEGTRHGLTLDTGIPAALRALPGVAGVEAFHNQYVTYDGVKIRLGAGDADVLAEHGSLMLMSAGEPRALYRQLINADEVLASETMAIKHGIRAGGSITLPTANGPHLFHVAGIFLDYSSDQGYVLLDRGTYQRLWHDKTITDIAVYAAPATDRPSLRGNIQGVLGARPILLQASGELRTAVLEVFDNTFAITYALHLIAIAVSLLGVVGTLFALVLERQRELSLLRYLGLTRGQVRKLVLYESGLLGLTGALVGLLAGALLSALLIEVINRQSFGWSVQWHPPWVFILGALASLLAAALLAGLYPARLAASLPVAQGLRRE